MVRAHVRFGSKADMCGAEGDVRFTPNSDIKCDIMECRFRPIATLIRGKGNWPGDHAKGHPARVYAGVNLFLCARPDAVVGGLPIHRGPRIALDLLSYVVNDGQLFCGGGKCIGNRFVGIHFEVISV